MFLKSKVKKCDIYNKKYSKKVQGAKFCMLNDNLIWDFAFDVGPEYIENHNVTPKNKQELKAVAKFCSPKFNF